MSAIIVLIFLLAFLTYKLEHTCKTYSSNNTLATRTRGVKITKGERQHQFFYLNLIIILLWCVSSIRRCARNFNPRHSQTGSPGSLQRHFESAGRRSSVEGGCTRSQKRWDRARVRHLYNVLGLLLLCLRFTDYP